MAAVRIALAALALLAASPAEAQSVDRWQPYIVEASARTGVPVEWIERVMRAESGGRTTLNGRPIVSRAGAIGLMQLMPGTWADMRARLGLGNDPHRPRDNIMAGTYYLRLMYDRFGYPGLFAAYNAGPARYTAVLQGRSRLPSETRAYVATLINGTSAVPAVVRGQTGDRQSHSSSQSPIFFLRRGGDADASVRLGSLVPKSGEENSVPLDSLPAVSR